MENYDLLVVGNGFDLAMGYNTSYLDFHKWWLNNQQDPFASNNRLLLYFSSVIDSGFIDDANWSSYEKQICNYLIFLDYIFSKGKYDLIDQSDCFGKQYKKLNIYLSVNDIPLHIKNMFELMIPWDNVYVKYKCRGDIKFHSLKCRLIDIPNIEEIAIHIEKIVSIHKAEIDIFKSKLIKALENELERTEQCLRNYIEKETSISKSNLKIEGMFKGIKKILSFNYSHIAQKLFEVEDSNVCYVHGDINNKIVLGIDESMFNSNITNKMTYLTFYKKYRRAKHDTNQNYNSVVLNSLSSLSRVAIFGHSLDLSDTSILKDIFDRECDCTIYCYKETNSYKEKVATMMGIDNFDSLCKRSKIHFKVVK